MAGITKERLKELVKEVMVEETEYQAFFQKALDKAGKSIPSMSDEEKKAFFDKIDSAWNGKGEKSESVNELMTYSARSKETGKVVMFKDKEHRDAAIKRGTFTPLENQK